MNSTNLIIFDLMFRHIYIKYQRFKFPRVQQILKSYENLFRGEYLSFHMFSKTLETRIFLSYFLLKNSETLPRIVDLSIVPCNF